MFELLGGIPNQAWWRLHLGGSLASGFKGFDEIRIAYKFKVEMVPRSWGRRLLCALCVF
ncbi:MAG: hypothetical protein M3458_03480 [Acidobacteriota bacterium]|nr:hypothetical protein [Acidobacteriota bacterium]